VAVGFQDVDAVGQAVEEGSREPLVAQDLRPSLKGQVGGDDEAGAFVGSADDLEEEFHTRLREGDVAELVEEDQVQGFELGVEAFELSFLAAFEELELKKSLYCEANPDWLAASTEIVAEEPVTVSELKKTLLLTVTVEATSWRRYAVVRFVPVEFTSLNLKATCRAPLK
jgi:hypothetical protein